MELLILWIITSDLGKHFEIGFGFFFLIGTLLLWQGWHRWPFTFGNGFLGSRNYWIPWIFVFLGFEAVTSIGSGFYNEFARSPIEALFIAGGAFLADRILSLFEIEVAAHIQSRVNSRKVKDALQSVRTWWEETKPNQSYKPNQQEENLKNRKDALNKFDETIKDS